VAEFGRYDDLISLLDTQANNAALEYLKEKFYEDMQSM